MFECVVLRCVVFVCVSGGMKWMPRVYLPGGGLCVRRAFRVRGAYVSPRCLCVCQGRMIARDAFVCISMERPYAAIGRFVCLRCRELSCSICRVGSSGQRCLTRHSLKAHGTRYAAHGTHHRSSLTRYHTPYFRTSFNIIIIICASQAAKKPAGLVGTPQQDVHHGRKQ